MAVDALIFDDDSYFAGLMKEILTAQGLSVKYYPDGEGALEHIRAEMPGLVLTDVMMPGLDGISLCNQVKSDPKVAAWTKVIVVSGKPYPEDKARAAWAKADLYLQKPFDVQEFSQHIKDLMRGRERPGQDKPAGDWTPRVWGGEQNAACVSFRDGENLIVFDAGDSLDAVAEATYSEELKDVWLLLSNTHQEHTSGLAHVERWVKAGINVHLLGPADPEFGLQRLAKRALSDEAATWVRTEELRESRSPYELIPGISMKIMATLHPGPCLAYRLEGGPGHTLAFVADSELDPKWEEEVTDYSEKLIAFAKGADIFLHDARYSDADIAEQEARGHSNPSAVARLAVKAGVKNLILYGTDPKYSEQERRSQLEEVKSLLANHSGAPEVFLAYDGLEVAL
jgi:DNA-binding response OmpR family regulator